MSNSLADFLASLPRLGTEEAAEWALGASSLPLGDYSGNEGSAVSDFYSELTDSLPVEVRLKDAEVGKGLFALEDIQVGDSIIEEPPLLVVQTLGERQPQTCVYCLCILGPLEDQAGDFVDNAASEPLPFASTCVEIPDPGPFPCHTGCPRAYCSQLCAKQGWVAHHSMMCAGPAPEDPAQDAANPVLRLRALCRAGASATLPEDADADEVLGAELTRLCGVEMGNPLWIGAHLVAHLAVAAQMKGDLAAALTPLEMWAHAEWCELFPSRDPSLTGEAYTALVTEKLQPVVDLVAQCCNHTPGSGLDELFTARVLMSAMSIWCMNGLSVRQPSGLTEYLARVDTHLTAGTPECTRVDELRGKVREALGPACEYSASGRALAQVVATANHSCAPNAAVMRNSRGNFAMNALRTVYSGEEITISYVDTKLEFAVRRQQLKAYGFDCRCERCVREAYAAKVEAEAKSRGLEGDVTTLLK